MKQNDDNKCRERKTKKTKTKIEVDGGNRWIKIKMGENKKIINKR